MATRTLSKPYTKVPSKALAIIAFAACNGKVLSYSSASCCARIENVGVPVTFTVRMRLYAAAGM